MRFMGGCQIRNSRAARTTVVLALIALSFLGVSVGCSSSESGDVPSKLSIAVLPDMAPNDLEEKHASLIAYLAETLDTPCEFIIPDSYEDIVDLIAEGEADIALVGGYTYVLAKERSDIATLVSRDIDRFFTTTFIANSALEVESLEDTKSLKFAFGSELSRKSVV